MPVHAYFELGDPNEERYLMQIKGMQPWPHVDEVPSSVLEEMTSSQPISIGQHNVGEQIGDSFILVPEVKQIVVGLEAQGRIQAANFLIAQAAKHDRSAGDQVPYIVRADLFYEDGTEVPLLR